MDSNLVIGRNVKEKIQNTLASPKVSVESVNLIIAYGHLLEWCAKVISTDLGRWISTPLGTMLIFEPEVSNSIGIDTDSNNVTLSDNLSWFAQIPWAEAAYMNDGLVFKAYFDSEVCWFKFHISEEARNLIARNCEFLKMDKIHFLSYSGNILSEKHVQLSRYEAPKPFK
jgi:hypothetical protein